MHIIAADDERLALKLLVDAIQEAIPKGEVHSFQKAEELFEFARNTPCKIAFLDIKMQGINGILMAKKLKEITPDMNIIFVTGYSEYALEAIHLHASGYLLKPVTSEQIIKEMQSLRYPISEGNDDHRLKVITFRNFEVYYRGKPVVFPRNKSKEIFAYLVDRGGTSATYAEIAAILWEDGLYDRSRQKQLQVFISDMMKTLAMIHMEEVIIKNRIGIMVDVTKINCDMYNFLQGDSQAVNAYHGEYMACYSWAEFTVGILDDKVLHEEKV